MAEKQEIRVRLALVGPEGSGKTAALECLHRTSDADTRGPLIQVAGRSGQTLLYDHAEFQLGDVGELPLFVDVYALPGSPHAVLARRSILAGCDGFLFTADGRDTALQTTRAGFQELVDYLAERERTPTDAALVAILTRQDLLEPGAGTLTTAALRQQVGDQLVHVSTKSGDGLHEALRKATALVLSLEREELEARRKGQPPRRRVVPPDLEEDIELAHQVYLRARSAAGEDFSPHGDDFLGQVLRAVGAISAENLDEALRVKGEAQKLSLGVSLEDILTQRQMVDPAQIPRALRLRSCAEVIHEELLFGKIATENGAVAFARVKQALALQAKRFFHHSVDHLLTRAGHLDRLSRRQVLIRLLQVHQGELLRESTRPPETAAPAAGASAEDAHVPLFGEVALNLGLVTEAQIDECLREQRSLREKGKRRFLGQIMQGKGYLSEDEIRRICGALEERIADDRIEGYRIVSNLGRGNMALVYAAVQLNLDRMVALKILDPKLLFDAEFIERFLSEARAAARLNHPNIVQAYDVGSRDDLHYFAMEFVDGITARKFLDESNGRLDEDTAIDIVHQVARALEHAAHHKLVHRDVKPGNVMITRDGVIKLCDLGLAKVLDAEGPGEEAVVLGSPYYIAPEQIEGRADVDIRADVYSLGAMFFHLVTGRPPFVGQTPEDVCLKHLSEPVPDPAELSATATRKISPLVYRMMAKNRRDRFGSCGELIRELERLRPDAGTEGRRQELSRRVCDKLPTRRFLMR